MNHYYSVSCCLRFRPPTLISISSFSFTNNIAQTCKLVKKTSLKNNNSNCNSVFEFNNCTHSFTWDDVFTIMRSNDTDSSNLTAFIHKINICNRNSEKQHEFIPFVIEDQLVGYVHTGFTEHLKKYGDVFVFNQEHTQQLHFGNHVTIHPMLRTAEERTRAIADVVKCLGQELIPGIRNELYPVSSSFGGPVYFSLERAAAPYFGIKAYGVHMNGYVERRGVKFLWLAKRSETKATYPGMLDHLVAGGLPHGISCAENIIKECEEEAGIPSSMSNEHISYKLKSAEYIFQEKNNLSPENIRSFVFFNYITCMAVPVGAVSYTDIDGFRYKRDVLFCYDLKLPEDFIPSNQDGEVESFKLVPIRDVANVIQKTEFFKTNCNLVIIDFLFRHGYIRPDSYGYLKLLQSLRSGDCS